jgi:hypothetical protein
VHLGSRALFSAPASLSGFGVVGFIITLADQDDDIVPLLRQCLFRVGVAAARCHSRGASVNSDFGSPRPEIRAPPLSVPDILLSNVDGCLNVLRRAFFHEQSMLLSAFGAPT